MCGTSVGNTSGPVSNGSVSNGQMRTSSSPAGMMMISGGTTPSPRATSNSPGYSHGHMSNNVPSPQNFAPLVHTTVTPPSSTYHGHSPINHHSTNENNNKTYDVMNRLKNRIEMYREHHENSLAKEQNFIDQYHHKVKTETTRLVKKQNAANESAAGSGGSRKKNSNIGSGSTGGGGRSRSTSTMNASKRSASCLMVNSNNLNNSISSGAISTIDSSTSSSPISNGPLPKAKVPRMTAKQRKLFKQQQMEGSAITSDSQLLINCSNRTQAINTSSSHQTTSTTNADLLNASSVYKFDPHSPNEIKPPLNFLSNNSGLSSSYQQNHVSIKQESNLNTCSNSYLGQLDASSLHDILENNDQSNQPRSDLQSSSITDDDSKDLINQILELDQDSMIGSNGQNSALSNEYSIFGTSADDSLSNRFGDEDFIKKMLEDLNNGFDNSTVSNNNLNHGRNSLSQSQMLENYHFNDGSSTSSPIMNGHVSGAVSQMPPSSHVFDQNSFNSFSNPSTPMVMSASSPINSQFNNPNQQLPTFNHLKQSQQNNTLPSFSTLSGSITNNNQQAINKPCQNRQSPRLNAPMASAQVPNGKNSTLNNNNINNNPLFAQQQLTNISLTPTPPSLSPIANSHHQMLKSPYSRSNSTGPPSAQPLNSQCSNLLLQPVMNTASPDPVRTSPSNATKMMSSPMMCRTNNTPSPVSPHQNTVMMCARSSSSTPPVSGANTAMSANTCNSGSNASVALKQMAQQQQSKWNPSTTCNTELYNTQPQQILMRHSVANSSTNQQRIVVQQHNQQNFTSQQPMSSQLHNANNTMMTQQYSGTMMTTTCSSQQQRSYASTSCSTISNQQLRLNSNNSNYFQQRPSINTNINANLSSPSQQQLIRTQNIRTQRMLQQQQQPKMQQRFINDQSLRPGFNTQPQAQQMLQFITTQPQQNSMMVNNQMRFSNNQNYWLQPPSQIQPQQQQQQPQQQQQQQQQQQYSIQNYSIGQNCNDSNNTGGYF